MPPSEMLILRHPAPPVLLQEVEYNITRDQDEKQYNMEVGQRVFVHVDPSVVMGFNQQEIDSAPIL